MEGEGRAWREDHRQNMEGDEQSMDGSGGVTGRASIRR